MPGRWPDERAATRSSARGIHLRESALLGSDLWVFRTPRPLPTSLYSISHNNAAAPVRHGKRCRKVASAIRSSSAKKHCASLESRRRPGKRFGPSAPQGTPLHSCKELDMFRKPQSIRNAVLAAATLSLATSGAAFADDSSIAGSPAIRTRTSTTWTTAPASSTSSARRARRTGSTVAKWPAKLPAYSDPAMMSSARRDVDKSTSPIRDDRGG